MKTSKKYLLAAATAALFLGSFDKIEANSKAVQAMDSKEEQTALLKEADVMVRLDGGPFTEAQRAIIGQKRYITESECAKLRHMWLHVKLNTIDSIHVQYGMEYALGNRSLYVAPERIGTLGWNHNPLTIVELLEKASLNNVFADSRLPLPLKTLQSLYRLSEGIDEDEYGLSLDGDEYGLSLGKDEDEYGLSLDEDDEDMDYVATLRRAKAEEYLKDFFWNNEKILTEEIKRDIEDLIKGEGKYGKVE